MPSSSRRLICSATASAKRYGRHRRIPHKLHRRSHFVDGSLTAGRRSEYSLSAISALKNNPLSEDMSTGIVRGLDLYPRKRAQSFHRIPGEMREKDLKIALFRVQGDALEFSIACRSDNPAKATGTVQWMVNALMTDGNEQRRPGTTWGSKSSRFRMCNRYCWPYIPQRIQPETPTRDL